MSNPNIDREPTKWTKCYQSIWFPVYLMLVLCGIAEFSGALKNSSISWLIMYLPFVFLFVAISMQLQIQRLEKSIKELEEKIEKIKRVNPYEKCQADG